LLWLKRKLTFLLKTESIWEFCKNVVLEFAIVWPF
jgi:hypothetical protein